MKALSKTLLNTALLGIVCVTSAFAKSTLTITFDGAPAQPRGTQYGVVDYRESGVLFMPFYYPYEPGRVLVRNGGGVEFYPDRDSAYLQSDLSGVRFAYENGSLFGVRGLELAGYSTEILDIFMEFTGFHPDGSTITAQLEGSGLDWRTVGFGPEWADGLAYVAITGYRGVSGWSMDNLVITIPEPGSGSLFPCGLAAALAFRRRKASSGSGV